MFRCICVLIDVNHTFCLAVNPPWITESTMIGEIGVSCPIFQESNILEKEQLLYFEFLNRGRLTIKCGLNHAWKITLAPGLRSRSRSRSWSLSESIIFAGVRVGLEPVKFCRLWLWSVVADYVLSMENNYGRMIPHSPENIGIWAAMEEK